MLETILIILALIPAMLGLAELLHILKNFLLSPKKRPKKYLLVFLEKDFAIAQFSDALEQQAWFGKRYCDKVFAVFSTLSESELEACHRLANQNKAVLCSVTELSEYF